MSLIGGYAGLAIVILCGFIERPIYSAAGVKLNALAYSLQANFLSAVIGFFYTGLSHSMVSTTSSAAIGISLLVMPVVLATAVEWLWVGYRSGIGIQRLNPARVLLANVVSVFVVGLLPVGVLAIWGSPTPVVRSLYLHQDLIALLTVPPALLILLGSFAWRRPRVPNGTAGFEVLPAKETIRPPTVALPASSL